MWIVFKWAIFKCTLCHSPVLRIKFSANYGVVKKTNVIYLLCTDANRLSMCLYSSYHTSVFAKSSFLFYFLFFSLLIILFVDTLWTAKSLNNKNIKKPIKIRWACVGFFWLVDHPTLTTLPFFYLCMIQTFLHFTLYTNKTTKQIL